MLSYGRCRATPENARGADPAQALTPALFPSRPAISASPPAIKAFILPSRPAISASPPAIKAFIPPSRPAIEGFLEQQATHRKEKKQLP
jgi:hypothetical protein